MTEVPTDAKQPEDHKKSKDEPYVWKSDDGTTISLKPFKRLPAGLLEDIEDMGEIKGTFTMLRAATSDSDYQVLRAMPMDDLEDLQAGWMKASGVDLPES